MQVTQLDDRITHAVIGGKQAQSFEIAQTAEFFRIMSSSLYSNKKLAVIREVLCNGWDAHVEAGCTDIPLDVTLTEDKLTIRDYGNGIHDSMIVPIYGTYGGSTKTSNDEVTGGFGLGCKAPFAYVDHFEVTSFHQGTKTIYNMALSSAQVKGKPGIQTIVSLPTDETGLEVSMDIQPCDKTAFEVLIMRIVAAGEMAVKLNGQLLNVLPFSRAKDGFLVLDKGFVESDSSRIHIRYGHVIYPVTSNPAYRLEFEKAVGIMDRASGISSWSNRQYGLHLVLQAAPNTISVTPSRETVEMTDFTIATIKDLLGKFVQNFENTLGSKAVEVTKECIERIWLNNTPKALFETRGAIPNLKSQGNRDLDSIKLVDNFTDLSRKHLSHHYPQTASFRQKDLLLRIDALIESGFDRLGLARSLKAEIPRWYKKNANKTHWDRKEALTWFTKKLVWPIVKEMAGNELLNPADLSVYNGDRKYRGGSEHLATLEQATKYTINDPWDCLPFLRGVVLLAHNRTDVATRPDHFPIFKHWLGKANGSLVYIVPRNAKRVEVAREFFTKLGFHLVDMTQWQDWETPPERPVRTGEPRKKLKKGVALLNSIVGANGELVAEQAYAEDAKRTEKPEFIVKIPARTGAVSIMGMPMEGTKAFIRLYGHLGGIVANDLQAVKLEQQGIPDVSKWLHKKLKDEIIGNAEIEQHYAFNLPKAFKGDWSDNKLKTIARVIFSDSELRKYFKFPDKLDSRNTDLIEIWEQARSHYSTRTIPEWTEIHTHINSIKFNSVVGDVEKKIRNNNLLKFIKEDDVLRNIKYSSESKARLRKLILHIFEG